MALVNLCTHQAMSREDHMPARDLKVAHAKELLKRIGGRGCVVIMLDDEQFAVAEWGRDKAECSKLKRFVDAISDRIASGDLPTP